MKNIYTKRRSLKEGYGAGYTVASNHYENIKINKLELGEPDEKGNYIIEGANLDITADAHITVDHPEEFGQVYESPIVITRLLVNDQGMSKEDLEEFIVTELNYFKTRSIQGGGWSHVEFTGNVCSKESEIDCDVYAITEATIQMTNNDHIKFLDDVLKGDLHYTDYIIDTEDGELEPESDMNQAIEKAKEINAISVTAIEYAKTDYDGDYEELSTYSVWPEVNTLEFESAKRSYKRIVEEKHFPSYNELYDELVTKIELELGINVEGHEDAANWIEGAVDYMLQSIEYGAYKGEAFDVVEEWWKDTTSNYPEMINELKEMFPANIKENAEGKDSYAIQSRNSNRLYSAIKDSELPTIFKNKLDAEQYIMKHNLEKEYFVVHLDESKNKDNSYAFVFECNNSTGKRKIIKQVIVNAKTIEEATKIAETEVNDRYVEEIENANGKYVLHEGRLTGKRVCEAIE